MNEHPHRILLTNLGYARGINGSMAHHLRYMHRNLWCAPRTQRKVLSALKALIDTQDVDICGLLEIDTGSFPSGGINQLNLLQDAQYNYAHAENKYAINSPLRRLPFTVGKSNGFIARRPYPFKELSFQCGTKRLIYRVELEPALLLYFTHFSLSQPIRERQLRELFDLADRSEGEVILMGDFNILTGLSEIEPLLKVRPLTLMNDPGTHTFLFHHRQLVLDLCICSNSVARRATLEVIPQPYSDHAALLLDVPPGG